jgi:hypothetical protein
MRGWGWALALVMVLGCGGNTGAEDSDDTDVADSDTTATSTEACTALTSGRWAGTGAAFGMAMEADLAVDDGGCGFTFSNWNMSMSVPDGGVVAGDTVTFTGNAFWSSCSGTITNDGAFGGTCSDDGSDFEMNLLGR